MLLALSELCVSAAQFGLLVAGWEEMVLKVLVLFCGAEGLKKVRVSIVFTSCRTNGQFLPGSTADVNLHADERLTSL